MLKIRVWDSIKKKFITNKKCIIDNLEKDDENNSIELNSAGRYIFLNILDWKIRMVEKYMRGI